MTKSLKIRLLVATSIASLLSCADDDQERGYIETPYPDEIAFFCQWNRFGTGQGEPVPTGPDGTSPHEIRARFPVPETGSCADIDPNNVDEEIIREAQSECDAPIEGIARGCYGIFGNDPECVFFAYYFSSCTPPGEIE